MPQALGQSRREPRRPPSSPRPRTGRRPGRFERPGSSAAGEAKTLGARVVRGGAARRGVVAPLAWPTNAKRRDGVARPQAPHALDLPVGKHRAGRLRTARACVERAVTAGETDVSPARGRRRARSASPTRPAPITATARRRRVRGGAASVGRSRSSSLIGDTRRLKAVLRERAGRADWSTPLVGSRPGRIIGRAGPGCR